jgi:hypothetical protein
VSAATTATKTAEICGRAPPRGKSCFDRWPGLVTFGDREAPESKPRRTSQRLVGPGLGRGLMHVAEACQPRPRAVGNGEKGTPRLRFTAASATYGARLSNCMGALSASAYVQNPNPVDQSAGGREGLVRPASGMCRRSWGIILVEVEERR